MPVRIVKNYDIQEVKEGKAYLLHLGLLPPATYIIRTETQNGLEFQKKLVIK